MSKLENTLSLDEVSRRLDEAGIPWAVFAGTAAFAYGATRSITDVDILIPTGKGKSVAALFPEATVQREEDGSVEIHLPGFDLLAGLTWSSSEFSYSLDLDAEMMARMQRHEIKGVKVPVIPPEDNILLKALAGRGPEQGKHDWEDVAAMLAHQPELDWDYLQRRADACGPSQRVQQALQRLASMRERKEQRT